MVPRGSRRGGGTLSALGNEGPGKKSGGVRGTRHRLLGPRTSTSQTSATNSHSSPSRAITTASQARKKRVLFVCIGNSCRSQMAEAFARAYGSDVMDIGSAGVNPATIIAPLTKQTLAERNLQIDDPFPKHLDMVAKQQWDLIVNMSGTPLSLPGAQTLNWKVQDPIGLSESVYRDVAGQIERLVMRLILELRGGA